MNLWDIDNGSYREKVKRWNLSTRRQQVVCLLEERHSLHSNLCVCRHDPSQASSEDPLSLPFNFSLAILSLSKKAACSIRLFLTSTKNSKNRKLAKLNANKK